MTLDDTWKLLRRGAAVAAGHGDDLVVGRVATIDNGKVCVCGCDARGVHASHWCEPEHLRHADDAEAEMYEAWRGLEFYRDVFPQARAWIDVNVFAADEEDGDGV